MIYVVSAKTLTETLPIVSACRQFKKFSDAKEYAKRLTDLWGNPVYVYSFGQEDCIEPKTPTQKFRLTFSKIKSTEIEVDAVDLREAIDIARKIYPKDLYELTRSELTEGDYF